MDKNKIAEIIENFAPLNLAEEWDCSGWLVKVPDDSQVTKIMFCLTVTEDILRQARMQNCDMIISHHPLFYVPLEYKDINIYCAHTNLDRANGGTTDALIKKLGLNSLADIHSHPFVRYVNCSLDVEEFTGKLCTISKNVRVVNNKGISQINKIAFCAGSGSEFIQDAAEFGADAFVTGDIKFHTAVESSIVLFDIGHFESEVPVLKVLEKLLPIEAKAVFAKEISPFKQV